MLYESKSLQNGVFAKDRCDKIVINGNVENFRMTSGNVEINGDVCGSVQLTGGEITCKTIKGNASVVRGSIKHA